MNEIGIVQSAVIGIILLWSGIWKSLSPDSGKVVQESALSTIITNQLFAVNIYRLLGVVEFVIGLLMLLPPLGWWEVLMSNVLSISFITYLFVAKKVAPTRSCGCMGRHGKAISWRTISRALYFFALASITWMSQSTDWVKSLVVHPYLIGVIAIELIIFVTLSTEYDWIWMRLPNVSNWYQKLSIEISCSAIKMTLQEASQIIQESAVYCVYSPLLTSNEATDSWRDKCWYFIAYDARYQDQMVNIVFATPVTGSGNHVRAAIVDQNNKQLMLRYDPLDLATLQISLQ